MKTLLVVGDMGDWDSFKKFYKQKSRFKKHGFNFKSTDYDSILECKFPKIDTKKVIVFFFFPFAYWDKNIETKGDDGVYGNSSYYIKFKKFWKIILKKVNKFYSDKEIFFVNHPDNISTDRDKELTKKILAKHKVNVSKGYGTRDYKKVLGLIDKGTKLFVKVRFGSMGKGITYLEKDRWYTNFRFRKGKIVSKKSDYGWEFVDVTNNNKFLHELMKQDILIEEAINPLLLKGRKFDLRLYVCFDKVLYVYPRSNDCEEITTNISQGAQGEGPKFIHSIPEKVLENAKKSAVKSTKAMGLSFAGIDIMPNTDLHGVTVIEANTFPGFPKIRSFNLSRFIINEIVKQKW